jgi:exopolyphosphatase
VDQGLAPDASPRIIKFTASCTTIVAEYMLSKKAIPPTELVDLMLRAIALDSGGLQGSKSTDLDKLVAKKLYESSGWNGYEGNTFKKVMKHLSDTLSARKDELAGLNVRDLLRRDWKSGL